jgi:DNA-binding response OmpR family regulator
MTSIDTDILYVEDDADARQMMALMLELSGLNAVCVESVEQARQLPNNGRFDLFLLDMWRHGGDGDDDLCRELRKEFPDTPIVVFTCAASEDKKAALDAGAADLIPKPGSESVVSAIVRLAQCGGFPAGLRH